MTALLAGVRRAVRWTAFALLALLVATPLAQVVMRGVFNVPMSGAEELARYFLICLTFIAASTRAATTCRRSARTSHPRHA